MLDHKRITSTYEAIKARATHILSIDNDLMFSAQRKQLLETCSLHQELSESTHIYSEENVLKVIERKTEADKEIYQRYTNGIKYLLNSKIKHSDDEWLVLFKKWLDIFDKIYEEPVITVYKKDKKCS